MSFFIAFSRKYDKIEGEIPGFRLFKNLYFFKHA